MRCPTRSRRCGGLGAAWPGGVRVRAAGGDYRGRPRAARTAQLAWCGAVSVSSGQAKPRSVDTSISPTSLATDCAVCCRGRPHRTKVRRPRRNMCWSDSPKRGGESTTRSNRRFAVKLSVRPVGRPPASEPRTAQAGACGAERLTARCLGLARGRCRRRCCPLRWPAAGWVLPCAVDRRVRQEPPGLPGRGGRR